MKNLNKLYWTLTTIMLLDLILYLIVGISFNGYLIDWLILWTWLILTPVVIILQFKKKWIVRYLVSLSLLILLSLSPMGIPFLSIYAYATTLDQNDSYNINSRLKVQESGYGVFAPLKIQVIKSYFLFEKIIGEDVAEFEIEDKYHYGLAEVESIREVENNRIDSLMIEFKFKEGTALKTF